MVRRSTAQQRRQHARLIRMVGPQVAAAIESLVQRLTALKAEGKRPLTPKEELVLRLNKQYPADVGVLSAFFLNLVTLKAGQVGRPSPAFQACVPDGFVGRVQTAFKRAPCPRHAIVDSTVALL